MCCGAVGYRTPQGKLMEGKTKEGLVTRHAYSLIDTYELPNSEKLCKVRNPWGNFEWKGRWSDNDRQWTQELKNLTRFVDGDDGVFFMSFDDFR